MPEAAPLTLKAKDFGLAENIRVMDHVITTDFPDPRLPENRRVSVHAFVWKNEQKLPKEANQGDAVCVWGLATSAHDAVQAIPALSKNYERVACISHPDGADATVNHPDVPINTDSFENSGRVMLNAIQELVDRGELRAGVTVYGHSTGNAVLMEAIARDCLLTEENPDRPRLISKAVLMAPAAILQWDAIEKIAFSTLKTIPQAIRDERRRAIRDHQEGLIKTKPTPPEKRLPLKEVWDNPQWKAVKYENIAFELIERVLDKFPIWDDFRNRLHLLWPDVLPHMWSPNATADVRHNIELVSTNCTDKARAAIKATPITVILFDEDTAVPSERFLTKEDHDTLNAMHMNDQDKNDLQTQLARIRGKKDEEYVRRVEERIEHATLLRKREEKRRELITLRVKEKFPNNPDTSVVVMSWEHHAAVRRQMGYIDALAQRDFLQM
jgi:pimeloyl-ACP methyl ester carboxylesterase